MYNCVCGMTIELGDGRKLACRAGMNAARWCHHAAETPHAYAVGIYTIPLLWVSIHSNGLLACLDKQHVDAQGAGLSILAQAKKHADTWHI
jgi:hypothetical protein